MGNEFLEKMGQRLVDRRKQLRMTQEETANKADLAIQIVSNSELGKTAIRPENMFRLCAALDISADYLLSGEIVDKEVFILDQKVRTLSPRQFQFLEDLIGNYINLCDEGEVPR